MIKFKDQVLTNNRKTLEVHKVWWRFNNLQKEQIYMETAEENVNTEETAGELGLTEINEVLMAIQIIG